ncbi:MAG: hypothetical protein R2880_05695 [Deinococcales bacterium]
MKKLLGLFYFLSLALAQTDAQPNKASFVGQIILLPWTMTLESYCQAGSDYYALLIEVESEVKGETKHQLLAINSLRDGFFAEQEGMKLWQEIYEGLAGYVDQEISISAEMITKSFSQEEHCPNADMSCISGPISCAWLRLETLDDIGLP